MVVFLILSIFKYLSPGETSHLIVMFCFHIQCAQAFFLNLKYLHLQEERSVSYLFIILLFYFSNSISLIFFLCVFRCMRVRVLLLFVVAYYY
jgi:hypothetical protein